MCYNISIIKKMADIEELFGARFAEQEAYEYIYHSSAFSAPYHPVITNENVSTIQFYQWGLIPFWIKDENAANRIRFRTLNARAETIHDKPAFRFSIKDRRCLVIVDGFYEWREVNKKKYPYYIKLVDNTAFAIAGIWDTWWNRETGETKNTFSIITTKANPLLERIHNTRKRMPVILKQEDHKRWLNTELDRSVIDSLLIPFDDKQMDAYPVSRLITTRGTNTNVPGVMEKYRYEELED